LEGTMAPMLGQGDGGGATVPRSGKSDRWTNPQSYPQQYPRTISTGFSTGALALGNHRRTCPAWSSARHVQSGDAPCSTAHTGTGAAEGAGVPDIGPGEGAVFRIYPRRCSFSPVGPQRGRSRSAGWQGERREGTAPHGEPHSLRGSQVLRLLRCGEPARVR
jgi:hypothetical protein